MGTFEGNIVCVNTIEEAFSAVQVLRNSAVIGFDTETRPSFKRGQKHKVSLLQLSNEDTAYLFKLNNIGLPEQLADLLAEPMVEKVGVAIHDDIKALQQLRRFVPGGFVELQTLVEEYGIENKSLLKLSALVLGFKISKKQQLSNWANSQLTEAQQRYAATDAWVSLKIYQGLLSN